MHGKIKNDHIVAGKSHFLTGAQIGCDLTAAETTIYGNKAR